MYGPPYRPRGRPYPRQGRRNNDSYIIYVLLSTIFRYINELEYKPPVTIAFLTLNIMVHLMPEFFLPWGFDFRSVRDICLLPAHILELLPSLSSLFSSVQGDTLGRGLGRGGRNRPRSGNVWAEFIRNNFSSYRSSSAWWSPSMHDRWREAASRIFLSALVHGDDVHLYYNMLSLLYKGATLERALGSLPFLRLVFFAWGVSHTLILLLATFLHSLSFPSSSFYSCSVGFSAVLFALKYVSYARDPDSWTTVAGFRVPLGKASWVELVVTSFLTPNASFLGHLCGILAGILWVEGGRVGGWLRCLPRWSARRTRYTYARASTGYRAPTPSAPPAPGSWTEGGFEDGREGGRAGRRWTTQEEEDAVLQEALRESLAEEQRRQAREGTERGREGGREGGEGVREGLFRPAYPNVPVAEVVAGSGEPYLPSYEEATNADGGRDRGNGVRRRQPWQGGFT